ncbi:MAG: BrnT family toxin [Methylococcales bacterium]|nr:BrnT family toxin [Methylococcales bacterium]
MKIEFDPEKNNRNIIERDLSFERVKEFDFKTALFEIDNRHDYGETRIIALGYIGERLHVLIFTQRTEAIRVISLRKANKKERLRYENKKKHH